MICLFVFMKQSLAKSAMGRANQLRGVVDRQLRVVKLEQELK
jgi:hypothetical protein